MIEVKVWHKNHPDVCSFHYFASEQRSQAEGFILGVECSGTYWTESKETSQKIKVATFKKGDIPVPSDEYEFSDVDAAHAFLRGLDMVGEYAGYIV